MAQKTITCPHCHEMITIDESLIKQIVEITSGEEETMEEEHKRPELLQRLAHFNNADSEELTIFVMRPSIREYIPRMIGALILSITIYTVTTVLTHQFTDFFSKSLPFLSADTVNVIMIIVVLSIIIMTAFSIFLSIRSTEYKLTSQRFFLKKGLIAQDLEEVELFRVKDVKSNQGILQRIIGIGDIMILSTDDSAPELLLLGVRRPMEIKEQIRTAYRHIRKLEGVKTTEFIHS